MLLGMGFLANAQTEVIDSIQTGPAYVNDVYYSFNTGKVNERANSDWQMAFSMGVFNVAVRTNATTSSSGIGAVTVYEMPGTDSTKYASFDTTGYKTWPMNENSDEDWEMGSLNQHSSSDDYGWGIYNASSHAVAGHRVYLFVIKTASGDVFRKVYIQTKVLGTWTFKYANIDGSNEQIMSIASTSYPTKNFVYVDMINNTIVDREPAKATWDFILTRYRALQPGGSVYYPSTGILTNFNVVTAEARGVNLSTVALNDHIGDTSESISEIGADWKQLSGMSYVIVDSLCYFVKAKDGAFWKLTFKSFVGSSAGKVVFGKTKLTPATGLAATIANRLQLAVYPNPAASSTTLLFDAPEQMSQIRLTDLNGKLVQTVAHSGSGFAQVNLPLDGLQSGVYLVEVISGEFRSVQRLVVQ